MEQHTSTYLAVRSAVRFVFYSVVVGVPVIGLTVLDMLWTV